MNILIDIGHPAHVHLFKNAYKQLLQDGHTITVTTKDVPIIKTLLEEESIPYMVLGKKSDSIRKKAMDQLRFNWEILRLVHRKKIDIGVGSSLTIAQVSKISRMKSIIMDDDDDEVEPLMAKYGNPFADVVLTPSAVKGHRNERNAIFYSGYHELAYLHPKRFTPDPKVLEKAGVKEGERFFIMRFNVFKAHHDIGIHGLSMQQKQQLIGLLTKYGKVFITTERNIEPEFKQYQLPLAPNEAHSLLYYSTMFLGDSQTMTSESAVLGVPAFRCNSFVGRISYLEEEEKRYGLTYGFLPQDFDKMFLKVQNLLVMPDLKLKWVQKRETMLTDKIDVSAFFTWFIENFPSSIKIMKENPNYQNRFQ